MIFGFNTDVKYEDVVYHVQSEVRSAEQLLQSQVFVRGRCVGKHATSFAERLSNPDFTDEDTHELLKAQHRTMVDAIRAGQLESLLGKAVEPAGPAGTYGEVTPRTPASAVPPDAVADHRTASAPVTPATPAVLKLEAVSAATVAAENAMVFRFRVSADEVAVSGARITSRLDIPGETAIYAEVDTADGGLGEVRVPLDRASTPDAVLLVQAAFAGRSTAQKFRLRRS